MDKDKSRNLSDKCRDCPYKDDWGLYDCSEGCNVPWDILEAIERRRNNVDQA